MRLLSAIPLLFCSALLLIDPCASAQVTFEFDKVRLSGEADPYGGVMPLELKTFRLGDDGTLLFHRDGLSVNRLYSGTYAGVTPRLADGARATGNRPVYDFLLTAGNDSGETALMGYDGARRNIYLLKGTALKTIAAEQTAIAGDGLASILHETALDSKGHLAFRADTTKSGMGIFYADSRASPLVVKKVAVVDGAVPGGGTFTFFDHRVSIATRPDSTIVVYFNASTVDAEVDGAGFFAAVIDGANPVTITRIADGLHIGFVANRNGQVVYEDSGTLYLADAAGSTVIAKENDPAPGGDTFGPFGEAAINDAGTIVFQASTGTGARALYVKTGADLSQLAIEGETVGSEVLQAFEPPQINENGFIVFRADVKRGGNPAASIFLSDGTTLVRVVGTDDALAGSFIQPSTFDRNLLLYPRSLNIHGQVAFAARLTNGKDGVFIATPVSHLRAGGPGLWDDASTWDYRMIPGPDTPVVADSAADMVLRAPPGPLARKVRSVTVGGGDGTTTLRLHTGSTLTTPKGVTLLDKGTLAGTGTIVGNLTMGMGSRLELGLAEKTRASYDFLRVAGTAALGGTLAVTKQGAFEPTRGQTFDLLDLTNRVGTFASPPSLPLLNPGGQTWDTSKLYTAGWITVSGATLFEPTAGVYTGTFEGNSVATATAGSLQLTLAANGLLSGSIYYAGRRYTVGTTLNVDGSGTMTFGVPKKTLQVQVAKVNQVAQLTATVSTGAGQESQAAAARNNPGFLATSPFVGHYTIALPPDPAHTEATFPQGTGYAKVTVTTRGLVTLVGVLGDGTPLSTGGQLTEAGEFPFYIPLYALKGMVAGKLVLHGSLPTDPVEGSFRWLKAATPTGKFRSEINATVTIYGSGYQNPVAPAKILAFASDTATFHAVGSSVDAVPEKTVLLGTAYAFKSTTSEPFAFTFSAATFGLGSGTFRDGANKVRTMKGVALQKQNAVIGLLIGTEQNGTFDID